MTKKQFSETDLVENLLLLKNYIFYAFKAQTASYHKYFNARNPLIFTDFKNSAAFSRYLEILVSLKRRKLPFFQMFDFRFMSFPAKSEPKYC